MKQKVSFDPTTARTLGAEVFAREIDGDLYQQSASGVSQLEVESESEVELSEEQIQRLKENQRQKQMTVGNDNYTFVMDEPTDAEYVSNGRVRVGNYVINYRSGKQGVHKLPKVAFETDELVEMTDADSQDEALDKISKMSDGELQEFTEAYYDEYYDREIGDIRDRTDEQLLGSKEHAYLTSRKAFEYEQRQDTGDEKLDPISDDMNKEWTQSIIDLNDVVYHGSPPEDGMIERIPREDILYHRYGGRKFGNDWVTYDECQDVVEYAENTDEIQADEIAELVGSSSKQDEDVIAQGMMPFTTALVEKTETDDEGEVAFSDIPDYGKRGAMVVVYTSCGRNCSTCPNHGPYIHLKYRDANGNSTSEYIGSTKTVGGRPVV